MMPYGSSFWSRRLLTPQRREFFRRCGFRQIAIPDMPLSIREIRLLE
jgi:hypothetical protein